MYCLLVKNVFNFWLSYLIIDSYVQGIRKLKLYQQISDIDTDPEVAKSQRKNIFKRSFESSDSEEENSQSLINRCSKPAKKLREGEKDMLQSLENEYPAVPKTLVSAQDVVDSLSTSFLGLFYF